MDIDMHKKDITYTELNNLDGLNHLIDEYNDMEFKILNELNINEIVRLRTLIYDIIEKNDIRTHIPLKQYDIKGH